MRIIYATRPFRGHLHPFVPLGKALLDDGHDVAVATAEAVLPTVEEAGLAWLPAGVDPARAAALHPEADADYGVDVLEQKVSDLLQVSLAWFRPDVILREQTDLAAALAAELSGVPDVVFGVGHFVPPASWQALAGPALHWLRGRYGLPPDPGLARLYASPYLDTVPPVWQRFAGARPADLRLLRYEPWDGARRADSPEPPPRRPGRARALVTLGTVYDDDLDLLDLLLDATSDLDVICTGANAAAVRANGAPHLAAYLPHSAILPTCDVVVCHGGYNTVLGALSHGVPVVVVPLASDQFFNAARVADLGAGVVLDRQGLRLDAVRDAVARVLGEPSYRGAAQALRASLADLPSPAAAARRLLLGVRQQVIGG